MDKAFNFLQVQVFPIAFLDNFTDSHDFAHRYGFIADEEVTASGFQEVIEDPPLIPVFII